MSHRKYKHIIFITLKIFFTAFFIGCNSPKIIRLPFGSQGVSGSDSARTIGSIQKVDDFYCMTFIGSYEDRLQLLDRWLSERTDTAFHPDHNADIPIDCSIFSTVDDSGRVFLGRNLDNKPTGILLAQYNPPGKYRSFAFSRLEDLRIKKDIKPEALSDDEKTRSLFFPFYPTDGMNEKGLAIGLAGVHGQRLLPSLAKERIFVTLFIRRVLDNCATVAEVIEFSKRFDLFDGSKITVSHHFLIADAEGNSLIIEYNQGEMKYIRKNIGFQLITNSYVYMRPLESPMKCWRYKSLYNDLVQNGKSGGAGECLHLLQKVYNNSEWSVVYDLKARRGLFSVNGDYNRRYEFGF